MNDLRQRALGAILKNAIFSPVSALLIAAGIVLVGLNPALPIPSQVLDWSRWYWLIPIVPTWLGVVGANVLNKRAGEQAVSQMFREQFDVNRITNPGLRTNIAQAIAYRERIDNAVGRFGDTASRGRVQDVANQVDEWVHRIYSLATRLDGFRNDTVIQNDRKTALDSITQLNKRANASTDPSLRAEITDTIARRQDQLDNLNKLFNTMERADLQLENTLTSLGTVYSQVLLIDASDVNSSKTQRLRDSISEQVSGLQDVISSMDEVYGSSQDQLAQASKNMARK